MAKVIQPGALAGCSRKLRKKADDMRVVSDGAWELKSATVINLGPKLEMIYLE